VALAGHHQAALTGIAVIDAKKVQRVGAAPIGAGAYAKRLRDYRLSATQDSADQSIVAFESACKAASARYEVQRVLGDPLALLPMHARHHDLTVLATGFLLYHDVLNEPADALSRLIERGVGPSWPLPPNVRPYITCSSPTTARGARRWPSGSLSIFGLGQTPWSRSSGAKNKRKASRKSSTPPQRTVVITALTPMCTVLLAVPETACRRTRRSGRRTSWSWAALIGAFRVSGADPGRDSSGIRACPCSCIGDAHPASGTDSTARPLPTPSVTGGMFLLSVSFRHPAHQNRPFRHCGPMHRSLPGTLHFLCRMKTNPRCWSGEGT
jgi:hypothetical protein